MKPSLAFAGVSVVLLLVPLTRAQEAAKADQDELEPEVEIAFREFSKKAADSRRKKAAAAVEKRAEELAREVKLDVAAKAKLADFYPRIVEATQAAWQDRFQAWLRPIVKRAPDPAAIIEGWDAEQMARNPNEVWARPDRTTAWKEALKDALNPTQLARYESNEKARLEKVRQDTEDFLGSCENQAIEVLTPMMEAEVSRLQQLAEIEEARIDRLKAAAEATIAEIAKGWRELIEGRMLDMEDEQRTERVTKLRLFRLDPSQPEYNPKEHKGWQAGLTEILTDAERTLSAKRREEIWARRSQALAMVLIEALDPYLGLTGDQRVRLRTLLAEPLLNLPDSYFISHRAGSHYSVQPEAMYAQISDVAETELRSILEEAQVKRWSGLSRTDLARYHRPSSKDNLPGLDSLAEEELDALEMRRVISMFLNHRAKLMARKKLLIMEAKADAVTRVVADLSPEQISVLNTAAKGSAQILAASHIQNVESWTRQNLQNVEPDVLIKRLKSLSGPYSYSRTSDKDPALWTETIERILSPPQQEAWKAEHQTAEHWQRECQLAIVISEIEKSILLTPQKRQSLQELVTSVLEEYHQEFGQMLSPQWHWEGYYCLLPLAISTEEQLAPIFDAEELTTLRGQQPGHLAQLIESLRKRHQDRVKSKP